MSEGFFYSPHLALVSLKSTRPAFVGGTQQKDQCMKIVRFFRLLAAASLLAANTARAATFDDILYWIGTGANRAAFVIDWNDGKAAESLVWGYRWDGAATGLSMFQAIVTSDPRLFGHLGSYSWGTAIHGIGFDRNENGTFGVTPSLSFDGGGLVSTSTPDDLRAPTEAADHYLEGWNSGFWGYNLKNTASDAWTSALIGPSDRVLADGMWDGYSFAPGFGFTDPSEPLAVSAVPEPATYALFTLAALVFTCARRKH